MNYKEIIKKQSFIIGISVFVMAIVLIGTSFAIIKQVDESTEVQVVETGTLNITYTGGTQITGSLVPLTNEAGLEQTGYSFTVENVGSLPMQYDIKIHNAEGATNCLAHQYIMISIDGSTPALLSSLPRTTETATETDESNIEYVIASNQSVGAAGTNTASKTHNVKVWIEEEAPEDIIGKVIALDVSTFGIVEGSETN